LTPQEKRKAMESLIFLTQKRDNTIKARTHTNGSMQRSYIPKDEALSPTAATEAVIITGVIKVKQGHNVMTLDVLNAFIQTPIPESKDKIIMKICGHLVDLLLDTCPGVYDNYVVHEGKAKHNIFYV
jgi:hypothetical protein